MNSGPAPVESDSRGILHPGRFSQAVRLTRFPPTAALAGLIDRFWVVEWDLPVGEPHRQEVLAHPCANLSMGWREGTWLAGVTTRVVERELSGSGWNVAAMTTPGGLGAFLAGPAAALTDRYVPLTDHLDAPADLRPRCFEPNGEARPVPERVAILGKALEQAVVTERVAAAREVAQIAGHAERDRNLRTTKDLAAVAGYGIRTLQRMFADFVGVPPAWVLRRYRLIDAAEAVRDGQKVDWADLAGELGYADQSHLVRDFRSALGVTPAAYARAQGGGAQARMSARS